MYYNKARSDLRIAKCGGPACRRQAFMNTKELEKKVSNRKTELDPNG